MLKMGLPALLRMSHVLIFTLALSWSGYGQDAPKEVQDPGWPRVLEKDGKKVVIYQPQVDSWEKYQKISARAAVAVSLNEQQKPAYGVIELQADTKVDPDTRMVLMSNPQREIRFSNLAPEEAQKMTAIVTEALPQRQSLEVALDRVLAYVDAAQAGQREVKVNLQPPVIFFSDKPAILVLFRGAPEFKPIPGTSLMFAVNANWDVLMDTTDSKYYLLNKDSWITASDPVKGPWKAVSALPEAFSKIPATDDWKDVRAAIPAKPAASVPAVFASDKPAEIILTEGEPKYSPIPGTKLMYVTNTESPVFLCNTDGRHYFLVAGRWFRAKKLAGPWESATAILPAEFAKIPEDHPRAYVLASVPKTDAAEDAVLLASVPRKATVNRNEAKLEVAYAGAPVFSTIKGSEVEAAVNTPEDVFEVEGKYYCCHEGVWFTALKPEGPWLLCDKVPEEIYAIPASHPKHDVTYVQVYESTPETVVVGYTSGYTGEYVTAGGLLMYGAGLAYNYAMADQWYDHWEDRWDDWFDYQCPAPVYSYGMGAVYNPYYGGYYAGYGAVARPYGGAAYAYGPYRGAARTAYYNPATGAYARGAYRYGPAGSAYARAGYNPWTDTAAARVGGSNVYGSWGRSVVARDDEWARAGHRTTAAGTTGWVQTSEGGGAIGTTRGVNKFVGKTESGDVYAGRDGNVYRREDGDWQKWDDGGWNDVNRPDRAAAQRSAQSAVQNRQGITQQPGRTGAGQAARPSQQPARTGSGQYARPSQQPARTGSGITASPSQQPARAGSGSSQMARPSQQPARTGSGITASPSQQPARTGSSQMVRPSQQGSSQMVRPSQQGSSQMVRPSQQPARTGTGSYGSSYQRPASSVSGDLNYNYQARQAGNARASEYQRARSSPQPSQSYRPTNSSNYSRPSSSRPSSSYSRPSSSGSRGSYSRGSSGARSGGGRSGGGGRGGRR